MGKSGDSKQPGEVNFATRLASVFIPYETMGVFNSLREISIGQRSEVYVGGEKDEGTCDEK